MKLPNVVLSKIRKYTVRESYSSSFSISNGNARSELHVISQGAQAHALTTRSKWRHQNYKDLYETLEGKNFIVRKYNKPLVKLTFHIISCLRDFS